MPQFSIWIMIVVGAFAVAAAIRPTSAQDSGRAQAFDRCKAIDDDSLRLNCLRSIIEDRVAKGGSPAGRGSIARWRLVQTSDPYVDRKAVSIMRAAETIRSDPDLAGLMIRCGIGLGDGSANFEVLVVLLNPLPLRAHPNVRIKSDGGESRFSASIAVPGALVLLPAEATALATGPWQTLNELSVDVEDAGLTVHGVVALDGLRSALSELSANCPRDVGQPQ